MESIFATAPAGYHGADMRFLQLLWRLVGVFIHYRRAMKNLRACRASGPPDPTLEAFRRGDYQTALQGGIASGDAYFQGAMRMQLGQYGEAEELLKQARAAQTEPKLAALANVTLGDLYVAQRRYEEAMKCFNAALSAWSGRGSTHRSVAELWLRRGDNPAEALRWARLAVEKERTESGVTEETKAINLAEDQATLAWAIAVNSRNAAEVKRIDSEIAMPARTPVSSLAQIHCHLGAAYTILGDSTQSTGHFEYAAKTDPNGLWGRTAQSMMSAAHA